MSLQAEAKEICDTILLNIENRFQFTGHLIFAQLFDPNLFGSFIKDFPTQMLRKVQECYSEIDAFQLGRELLVFWGRKEMHNFNGLLGVHSLFRLQNLNNSFLQLIKLLQILITTELTTTEAERSFSATNRIETFLPELHGARPVKLSLHSRRREKNC